MDEDHLDADEAEQDQVLHDLLLQFSLIMALPPYLTTTILPWYRSMYGRACTRTWARSALGM